MKRISGLVVEETRDKIKKNHIKWKLNKIIQYYNIKKYIKIKIKYILLVIINTAHMKKKKKTKLKINIKYT